LITPEKQPPLVPKFLIPVGVDKTDLIDLAHALMIAPDNSPDDILEKSQVEEAGFYYLPCYMGQGRFDCQWSATFGFDRQESKTKETVTDWRPARGKGSARFLHLVCAADPSEVPQQVAKMLEESVPYTPFTYNQYLLGGYPSLDFAYSPQEGAFALESLVINNDATSLAHEMAKGDRQKDWSIDAVVTFDGPVKAGLLPLAKFVYSYEGNNYVIWAEDTKLERHIVEPGSIDKGRSTLKFNGYIPMWVILGTFAFSIILSLTDSFLMLEPTTFICAALLAFLFSYGYGALRAKSISNYSKALREAAFSAKRLEITDNSGSPLPDGERQALLKKSRPPDKPFLAPTENDENTLAILSFICGFAVLLGLVLSV
jgi:hypothetical protein